MKKLFISFILLALTSSYGQELNLPVATQYLADNPFVISPTYAGIGDNLRIRVNGMLQWVGIKDAPQNQAVYADFRIADQSGIGINLYNDKNGYTHQAGAKFSFAHHIILDYYSKQYLSFGMSFNINNFKMNIDEFGKITDKAVTDNRFTSNNNFDVSLLYRNKSFYACFNASNILDKNIDKFSDIKHSEPNLLLNYQIYSGYVFRTNNRAEFEPSAYFQYFVSDKRSSTDFNFKYRKFDNNDDYYWGGITYRFLNDQPLKPLTVGPMLGFKKNGFYFGYSYQMTLNKLASYNSGTHILTLGFDFLAKVSNCPCTQNPVHD